VVNITPWGEGEHAVLEYLARYVFRTAITNSRITSLDESGVTFRYKPNEDGAENGTKTGRKEWRSCHLSGHEFLRRFLQHVLPKGFHKVRYSGLWHASKRDIAQRVRTTLLLGQPVPASMCGPAMPEPVQADSRPVQGSSAVLTEDAQPRCCPKCHAGNLTLIRLLPPRRAMPP
jgi:hypothetical protein